MLRLPTINLSAVRSARLIAMIMSVALTITLVPSLAAPAQGSEFASALALETMPGVATSTPPPVPGTPRVDFTTHLPFWNDNVPVPVDWTFFSAPQYLAETGTVQYHLEPTWPAVKARFRSSFIGGQHTTPLTARPMCADGSAALGTPPNLKSLATIWWQAYLAWGRSQASSANCAGKGGFSHVDVMHGTSVVGNWYPLGHPLHVPKEGPDLPVCGDPATEGIPVPMDVAFVIDESGSMVWNDPQRVRVTASLAFVASMIEHDRAAVIGFETQANPYHVLTYNKAGLQRALPLIKDVGGTYIGVGVSAGLDQLTANPIDGRPRYVIMLTDGEGEYSPSVTARAVSEGIVIYTVGLGAGISGALLTEIAAATGGRYLHAESASDLTEIFQEIRDETSSVPCPEDPVANAGGPYEVVEGGTVPLQGTAVGNAEWGALTYAWDFNGDSVVDAAGENVEFSALHLDGDSEHVVTLTVCDGYGGCGSAEATVSVANALPVVNAGGDLVVFHGESAELRGSWTDPAGALDSPFAWVWDVPGTGSQTGIADGFSASASVASSDGSPRVATLTVTDKDGGAGSDSRELLTLHRPPSCIAAGPSAGTLWPPNHRMESITVTDLVGASGEGLDVEVISIQQDEPINGAGDGNTVPDAAGVGTATAQVRSERAGPPADDVSGRIYVISFRATDALGSPCWGQVQVGVPHSQNGTPAQDSGVRFDSLTGAVVTPSELPTITDPATLAISVDAAEATTPENEPVALTLVAYNLAADEISFHIASPGPLLGDVTAITPPTCEAWGDGTRCVATATYTPHANTNGVDTFTYVASDGTAGWEGSATVAIGNVNIAPEAGATPAILWAPEDAGPLSLRLNGRDAETLAANLVWTIESAPVHGELTVDGVPAVAGDTFTGAPLDLAFTSDSNFVGADTLVVSVTDTGDGDSSPLSTLVTIPITITPVNDAPQGETVAATTVENQSVQVAIVATDVDGDDLTLTIGGAPAHGTVSGLAAATCTVDVTPSECASSLTYTPAANFNGTDSFSVIANDGKETFEIDVDVTVAAVNSAPTVSASPAQPTLAEDSGSRQVIISASDIETPAAQLNLTVTALPAHGTLTQSGIALSVGQVLVGTPRTLTYTPALNYFGPDAFAVTVTDTGDNEAAAQTATLAVPITVTAVNDLPVVSGAAVVTAVVTAEDQPMVFHLTASDIDSALVTFSVATQGAHGTAQLATSSCASNAGVTECGASFTYVPGADFFGTDTVVVRAHDGTGFALATVQINVWPVNDAPVANGTSFITEMETTLSVAALDLAANDVPGPVNEGSQQLTVTAVEAGIGTQGTVSIADGVVTFVPAPGFIGETSFTYRVCDNGMTVVGPDPLCAQGTVTVEVHAPNTAPQAADVAVTLFEDGSAQATVTATDADGDALAFEISTAPALGELSELSAVHCVVGQEGSVCTATVTYVPNENALGLDGFTFTVTDGTASASGDVTLEIVPVNDSPTATSSPQPLVVVEDGQATVTLAAEDVETASGALAFTITTLPSHGQLLVGGEPVALGDEVVGSPASLQYQPNPDYFGPDTFEFRVSDEGEFPGMPLFAVGTVVIDVTEDNDAPIPGDVTASTIVGTAETIPVQWVVDAAASGPSNESGQQVTVIAVRTTASNSGSVSLSGGEIVFTPAPGFLGSTEFEYTVCDNGTTAGLPDAECADGLVQVHVTDGGLDLSAPIITLHNVTGGVGDQATILVTASDNRAVASLTLTVNGLAVAVDANGIARFTPTAPGAHALVAVATDPAGNTSTSHAWLDVLGANDGVTPVSVFGSPAEGAELSVATPIVGTANDANLSRWVVTATPELPYATTPIVLAEGTEPVIHGELAVFDPSVLAGGHWRITLQVIDEGGRIATFSYVVTAVNEAKYGLFSMTFTDAVIPVAGMPIAVQRTYYSGARAQQGDFGFGWTLSLNTLRLATDNDPGEGWDRENRGTFLPNYVLVPSTPHTLTVMDGNSETMVFDFTPWFIDPITDGRYATAEWTERTETGATIEPVGNKDLVLAGNTLLDLDTVQVYAPESYVLTMPDGREFVFSLESGMTKATDANGNSVTITSAGIVSSSGEQVAFERDTDGRITKVTTPGGLETTYSYDVAGNLVGVTDPDGNLTEFAYGNGSYLTGVIDALGRVPARNEYDSSGRLIGVVDAAGNRIVISSDPDGRTETVTDRLGHSTVRVLDERGRLVSQVFPDGTTETYTNDAAGNRTSRTDGLGNTWTATYDERKNRTSITDPLGNTRTWVYDSDNRVTSATDALGRTTTVTYDASGNATAVTYPDGTSATFTYDAKGNVLTEADESGRVTTHTYDSAGRRTSTTSPAGDVTAYTYDADGRLTSTTDPEGGVSARTYNGRGLVTDFEDALGAETHSEFDAVGQRTSFVDAAGGTTSYTYDALGRMTSSTSPTGGVTTYAYDAEGRVTATTSPDGVVRTTSYDSMGRVLSVRVDGVTVSSSTYDAAGRVATSTNGTGDTTSYAYDDAGRLVGTTYADGTSVTSVFDAAGQVTSQTSAAGTVSFVYDARGRATSVTGLDGETTTYAYDAAGRMVSETAPDGAAMTYVYDANGRLESATDALGNTASVAYDGNGQRVAVTDPLGRERVWSLDAVGRLLSYSVAGDVQLTQVFDAAGRLTSRTFGDGSTTGYAYDSAGRLTGIDYPDRSDAVLTYTDAGQRESVTDHRGTTTYGYDSRGRLTSVASPEGTVGYGYDNAGRVTSMTTAAGTTLYGRDVLGRIVSVTDPAGGTYAIDRDDAGRVTAVEFPNGVSEAYTYDAAGRPMTVTVTDGLGVELASFEATRDTVGRITALNDSVAGVDVERAFDYDAAGRLTQVVSDAAGAPSTTDYTLDGLGNRVTTTVDGAATSATVNTLDQLTALGSDSFTYDDAGLLTSATRTGGASTFDWTSQGELAHVTTPSAVVDYEYDLAGNVISRTEAGDSVEFVYDSLTGLPRAVSGSDGSWWVYVDGVPLAQHTSTGATAYLHTDVRGDVRLATNATGAVTDTWTYSVDGELTARTGTTPVTVGWRGETHDTTTGLIWLRARWYDPATARFLSADPWHGNPADPISLNRYLYGNADPVNMHDPTGLEATTLAETATAQLVFDTLVAISFTSYMALSILSDIRDNDDDRPQPCTHICNVGDDDIDGDEDPGPEPQPDGAGARDGVPPRCIALGVDSWARALAAQLGGEHFMNEESYLTAIWDAVQQGAEFHVDIAELPGNSVEDVLRRAELAVANGTCGNTQRELDLLRQLQQLENVRFYRDGVLIE